MRKKIIFFLGVLFLILAAWGWYLFNKPHTDVSNLKASVTINATELFNEYQTDEIAANKKYLDKIIEVKGLIAEVQQTDSTMNVLLHGGTEMGGVNCSLFAKDSKKNTSFRQGSEVVIKGKCAGFLMDVSLVDCVLVKQ